MFHLLLPAAVLILLLSGCSAPCGDHHETHDACDCGCSMEGDSHLDRVLRHVVLFRFKEGTDADAIRRVEEAFAALPERIDVIRDFEWGTDVSPEGLARGYTHCFFLTFANAEDRDAYLPHPEHKKFGQVLRPLVDEVTVLDYWTRR